MGIVERLREYASEWTVRAKSNAVVIEAADEIERLRSELSTARRAALLEAAEFIEAHMLCGRGDDEEVLRPRSNPGNKVGFAYAAALRAKAEEA